MLRELGGAEVRALTAFEVQRGLARSGARLALLLFVLILAASHWEEWVGRTPSEGMFGIAYGVGLMSLMCFGLAADRRLHFDVYLLSNHTRPAAYLGAKAVGMCALVLMYGVVAGAVEAVFSLGDVSAALWLAAALTLVGLLIAPFAMLVEALADTSMPAAFVLLVYFVAAAALYISSGNRFLVEATGLAYLVEGSWTSLGPIGLNVLVGVAPAFVLAGAIARLRLRRY